MKTMKSLSALTLLAVLAACGGSQQSGFDNETSLPNAMLADFWEKAQNNIANNPIEINHFYAASGVEHSVYLKPDTRAMQVLPNGVTVSAIPDLPCSEIPAAMRESGPCLGGGPSGTILMPFVEAGTQYVGSYFRCFPCKVFVAESRMGMEREVAAHYLVYEFENIILMKLKYDVSRR